MGRLTGDLKERTLAFGVSVLNTLRDFPNEQRGWTVARQLGRSATSIGANAWEADAAISEADFAHKISIARKEAHETLYWIELTHCAGLMPERSIAALRSEATELCKILGTIVRKTQEHVRAKGVQR